MKPLLTKSIAMIATLALISACSKSDSNKDSAGQGPSDLKTESITHELVGQFQGISATCEAGGEAKDHSEAVKGTLLTFNEDGTYITVTRVMKDDAESVLETKGTYSVSTESADVLILKEEIQSPDGEEPEIKETILRFQVTSDELTLTEPSSDDNSCPVNEALITKYQRVLPSDTPAEQETSSEQTTPSDKKEELVQK